MNLENRTPGAGRMVAGCLLGALLAAIAPLAVLTEILSLTVVLLIPSAALIWLHRWAGKGPAMLSAVLMMSFTAQLLGGTFMWMAFLATIMPAFVLLRAEKKPFFEQMKTGLAAFGVGIVLAVVTLYLSFGGNMVGRVLTQLPDALRSVPLEMLQTPMANIGQILGRELTPESFYQVVDEMIAGLVPAYQLHLPGLIFSGGIISAVFCVWLSGYMLKKRNPTLESGYRPLRDWALPPSTTGGLLLIAVVSYIAYAAGMRNGKTLYFTVYNIAVTAFCIQAIGSLARRLNQPQVPRRARVGITICMILTLLLGGTLYIAIYGCASAIFGSRGAVAAHKNDANNHHSDDEYRR